MEAQGGIGRNADGWSGHGGGEAEGQWINFDQRIIMLPYKRKDIISWTKYKSSIAVNTFLFIFVDKMLRFGSRRLRLTKEQLISGDLGSIYTFPTSS